MKASIGAAVLILFTSCSAGKNKTEVFIPSGDSIRLATDVFLPSKEGKFPAVLVRTPYNKDAEQWMGKSFNMFGIAVIIQDVRGKYKSNGEFYPFTNEREDGLKTLKWIREQPWSNGTVAGWGASYVGYTQWAISDSLDFLTLLLTGANLYDFTYPDSLFSLQTALVWGVQNASPGQNILKEDDIKNKAMILPVSAADDSIQKDVPFINDWITHEKYDDYWENLNHRGKTNAPVLSIAGWYDIFLKTQIADFQALEAKGNKSGRMIIGPLAHGSLGEINEYGGLKKTGKPQHIFMYVKNFLKGKKNKLKSPLTDKKYNLFIMERNEYAGSDVWPPAETTITPFYLGPSGYVGKQLPEESGSLQYDYIPSDPYPSHGGTTLGAGVGPARQNSNTSRKDQLYFEMEIGTEPLILLGPLSATLWLSSNVTCTDFFIEIQDQFPDGKMINIQEGGARVNFDNEDPKKCEISVWATGYQFNPGHKLRVVITSSWFPRFNRCLNLGEPSFTAVKLQNATQNVYYGRDMPSSINLPVYKMKLK